MEYRRSRHSVYLSNYHLVWCPKYRRRVLVGRVRKRLEDTIGEMESEVLFDVIAIETMPDHIHLFISTRPTQSIVELIMSIKGKTSSTLRIEFPGLRRMPALWTHSYFVSTVGNVSSEAVRRYMEAQGN